MVGVVAEPSPFVFFLNVRFLKSGNLVMHHLLYVKPSAWVAFVGVGVAAVAFCRLSVSGVVCCCLGARRR